MNKLVSSQHHLTHSSQDRKTLKVVTAFLSMTVLFIVSSVTGLTLAASSYPPGHPGAAQANPLPTAITPQPVPAFPDLGDAPDSTNHFNAPMTAYPGVPANFPTVFDITTGLPPGPKHRNQPLLYFLGNSLSVEREADIGPDADGINNLDPLADIANKDGSDNAFSLLPAPMPHCANITLNYKVTVLSGGPYHVYVNLWFDWERNGSWGGSPDCPPGAPEWAVQNQMITLPGPGTYTFTTPSFLTYNPDQKNIWGRITLSDSPAPAADGSGMGGAGYANGETEDRLIPGLSIP